MNKNQSNGRLPGGQSGSHLTIGFIGMDLTDQYTYTIWQGVMDAARARRVNLISFSPHDLGTTSGFNAQANVLHDLVSTDLFDGLVILTDPLLSYAGPERAKRMLDRYSSKPMVTITGSRLEGIPRLEVEIDNYQPMRAAVLHLVKEHGYRRIAFIRGPDVTSEGARQRYQAYVDALTESGLPFDANLVSPPTAGLWGPEVGQTAITLLLDERGVDVEAVVGANDNFALGAMQALQARGIHIPNQIAVVGFDDQSDGDSVIPPLTTVPMPGYDAGRQATEMLLTLLAGGQVPERIKLLPQLIIRQSCGCASPAVAQAATGPLTVTGKARKTVRASEREKIVSEMRQAAGTVIEGLDSNWAEQLLAAFFAELNAEAEGVFLSTLDGILRRVIAASGQVGTWANVISALRRSTLPYLGHSLTLRRAESLWLQAQVMIGETAQQAQRFQMAQAEQQAQILDEIRVVIMTTIDVEGLMDTLAQELPRLAIPGCYLSLYENPQRPAETSRLILAYDEQRGRLELPPTKQLFPSWRLAPEEILPQDRLYSMVVEPLYFREQQWGFVLFESGQRHGPIYDELRASISSALQGALLMQQEERRSRQLQAVAEVSIEASTMLLDTIRLLQKVVDLAKERFGLYHAHLYLVNQTENMLVLTAGAGEVGRQMVADGWRIPLDAEQSLVAQTAQTRQGRIASNVRDNPNWLPNSMLPDTCSELAVPLIAGERLVGVLDVQSDEINHFTEDDIRIQSTLAAQIAVTLENAALFERLDQANAEIKVLNEKLQEENVRMIAELNVAQQLQEMLLPRPEELQQIEGMDIAGYMKPADEVGGDYYDVLEHNGRVKIGIGDVTGHGLESGVVMLMLQTAVRTLLISEITDPIQFMDILNRAIHKNIERMNVDKSLSLALVDYATGPLGQVGQMTLSGQHEQLIVFRNGGHIELQDTLELGFPVGLIADIGEFVNELSINLELGDGMVLYSDGITEAENEAEEFYGLERLCQVISQHWSQNSDAIKQAVVDDVQTFVGEQIVYDDITLLVVKQK